MTDSKVMYPILAIALETHTDKGYSGVVKLDRLLVVHYMDEEGWVTFKSYKYPKYKDGYGSPNVKIVGEDTVGPYLVIGNVGETDEIHLNDPHLVNIHVNTVSLI